MTSARASSRAITEAGRRRVRRTLMSVCLAEAAVCAVHRGFDEARVTGHCRQREQGVAGVAGVKRGWRLARRRIGTVAGVIGDGLTYERAEFLLGHSCTSR